MPYDPSCPPKTASRWVQRFAHLAGETPSVLDLACGAGRHARFFLERGAAVTCIDRHVEAVADLAGRAEIIVADLEDGGPWPLAGRRFDAIIAINYLFRPLLTDFLSSLAPGGLFLYETFADGNERYDRPRNPDHLLRSGELLELVAGRLKIVAFEEGIERRPLGLRVVQRICAVDQRSPSFLEAGLCGDSPNVI